MITAAEVFRTPDERFEGLPGYGFAPHYLDLQGELAGLRMHYVEEGEGSPIVMLHGLPTWAYLYRKMIGPLAATGRVLVPDLIGFGRSDKVTDKAWYTYERHLASVRAFLDLLDLGDITLIVHDWGGPLGLRVATEAPERFKRLVILNTGLYRPGPNWPHPAFLAWRDFIAQNPDVPVADVIQGGTLNRVPDDVLGAYEAPYPDAASKAGAAAFPGLVPLTPEDPGADKMMEARSALEGWEGPVLVAFSDQDPMFPQRAGERLAAAIPGGSFSGIAGASHFLQEDAGEELAGVILGFCD